MNTIDPTITDPKISVVYYDDKNGVKRDTIQNNLLMVTMPCVSAIIANAWSAEADDPNAEIIGHAVRLSIALEDDQYGSLPFPEETNSAGERVKVLNLAPTHNGFNGTRTVTINFIRTMTDEEYDAMLEYHRENGGIDQMVIEMTQQIAEEMAKAKEED